MEQPSQSAPQPEYKLILLKTTGKCDSDNNLKIIGFTMPETFASLFSDESVTKEKIAQAITTASSSDDMKLDETITRDNLINNNCSSKTQTKPAELGVEGTSNGETIEKATEKGETIEKATEEEKTGDNQTSGGAKKQSKRNRKNRRNRRSQKNK